MIEIIGPERRYVAMRAHKRPCDLCAEPILKGQECRRWVCKEDSLMTVRVHERCFDEAYEYDWFSDPDGWPDQFPLREERAQQEEEIHATP